MFLCGFITCCVTGVTACAAACAVACSDGAGAGGVGAGSAGTRVVPAPVMVVVAVVVAVLGVDEVDAARETAHADGDGACRGLCGGST